MAKSLGSLAEAMFAAGASVLGVLSGRSVTAGAAQQSASDGSIRVEPDLVATVTRIPSADLAFVARYQKADLGRIVALMFGGGSENGEIDAMQLSIVAETVAQISSAMGEALASATDHAAHEIESTVASDAAAFPAPPFVTFSTVLDLGDGFTTTLALDFDVLAQHRLVPGQPAAHEPPPVPLLGAKQEPKVDEGQPIAFAPMRPTALRTAPPGQANLDLVHDVPLEISAVLGQTELSLREVVSMQTGSVFELDKLSTEPIDLYVNNILIARGEVVIVDDKFAVKISELNPIAERL